MDVNFHCFGLNLGICFQDIKQHFGVSSGNFLNPVVKVQVYFFDILVSVHIFLTFNSTSTKCFHGKLANLAIKIISKDSCQCLLD